MAKVATQQQAKQEQSWVPTLAFWLCLFVAAALYAVAFLSPKLLTHAKLSSRRYDNRAQMVKLQEHCEHLEIVQDALQTDPGIKAELARVEFDKVDPAEQRIPVGNGLLFERDLRCSHQSPTRQHPPLVYADPGVPNREQRLCELHVAGGGCLGVVWICGTGTRGNSRDLSWV